MKNPLIEKSLEYLYTSGVISLKASSSSSTNNLLYSGKKPTNTHLSSIYTFTYLDKGNSHQVREECLSFPMEQESPCLS